MSGLSIKNAQKYAEECINMITRRLDHNNVINVNTNNSKLVIDVFETIVTLIRKKKMEILSKFEMLTLNTPMGPSSKSINKITMYYNMISELDAEQVDLDKILQNIQDDIDLTMVDIDTYINASEVYAARNLQQTTSQAIHQSLDLCNPNDSMIILSTSNDLVKIVETLSTSVQTLVNKVDLSLETLDLNLALATSVDFCQSKNHISNPSTPSTASTQIDKQIVKQIDKQIVKKQIDKHKISPLCSIYTVIVKNNNFIVDITTKNSDNELCTSDCVIDVTLVRYCNLCDKCVESNRPINQHKLEECEKSITPYNSNGLYSISLTPKRIDLSYTLHIKIDGVYIYNSPYKLNISRLCKIQNWSLDFVPGDIAFVNNTNASKKPYIYIADPMNNSIHILIEQQNNTLLTKKLIKPTGINGFNYPLGICIYKNLLYVADTYYDQIHILTITGDFIKKYDNDTIQCGATLFDRPKKIIVTKIDINDNIIDDANDKITNKITNKITDDITDGISYDVSYDITSGTSYDVADDDLIMITILNIDSIVIFTQAGNVYSRIHNSSYKCIKDISVGVMTPFIGHLNYENCTDYKKDTSFKVHALIELVAPVGQNVIISFDKYGNAVDTTYVCKMNNISIYNENTFAVLNDNVSIYNNCGLVSQCQYKHMFKHNFTDKLQSKLKFNSIFFSNKNYQLYAIDKCNKLIVRWDVVSEDNW